MRVWVDSEPDCALDLDDDYKGCPFCHYAHILDLVPGEYLMTADRETPYGHDRRVIVSIHRQSGQGQGMWMTCVPRVYSVKRSQEGT